MKMLSRVKQLIKEEDGMQQGSNTILLIVVGAGIIIAVGSIFRERIIDLLEGTFDRFESESDDMW